MILDSIGKKFGTDKSSNHHNYLQYYERHFEELRNLPITLVEGGYGGYSYPDKGGESVRMWIEYFPNANIICFDLYQKNPPNNPRLKFYSGSQDDEKFLHSIIPTAIDIFIDDASHHCKASLRTFEIIFPLVKSGGWYVIEDIEGSFWDTWSGGTKDFEDFKYPSPVNLGRKLISDLNAKFIPNYTKQYDISEIHFYQNIIFIKKK